MINVTKHAESRSAAVSPSLVEAQGRSRCPGGHLRARKGSYRLLHKPDSQSKKTKIEGPGERNTFAAGIQRCGREPVNNLSKVLNDE